MYIDKPRYPQMPFWLNQKQFVSNQHCNYYIIVNEKCNDYNQKRYDEYIYLIAIKFLYESFLLGCLDRMQAPG